MDLGSTRKQVDCQHTNLYVTLMTVTHASRTEEYEVANAVYKYYTALELEIPS